MAQIDKKLVDCYWFLQNQCSKGETCEYRHWKAAVDNPITCTDFQQGKCLNKECNFRHPSTVIANLGKKSVVCFYFTRGGCMKGSSCPYSHEVAEADEQVQKLAQIKKQEEQELRRLQEERQKEEKRLAELKAQEKLLKALPKTQKQNDPQTARPKKKAALTSASFIKSVGEIQQQSLLNDGKRKLEVNKKQGEKKKSLLGKRPTITASEPASKQNLDFGIKNLDELIKEKEKTTKNSETSNGVLSTSLKSSSPPNPRKDISIDEIRKRNEQKFKNRKNTSESSSTSSSEPQQKKSKIELSNSSHAPTETKAISNPALEEDDVNIEDYDKELDELENFI